MSNQRAAGIIVLILIVGLGTYFGYLKPRAKCAARVTYQPAISAGKGLLIPEGEYYTYPTGSVIGATYKFKTRQEAISHCVARNRNR